MYFKMEDVGSTIRRYFYRRELLPQQGIDILLVVFDGTHNAKNSIKYAVTRFVVLTTLRSRTRTRRATIDTQIAQLSPRFQPLWIAP
jgi:hypothetical protein